MAGVKGRSGGFRVGAGRKPRAAGANWLSGTSKRRTAGTKPPAAPTKPVTMPADLAAEVSAVWKELAPHALAEGTLTDRTTLAFSILCRAIVVERQLSASPVAAGPDHRGMLQRVEAGMARFRLTPDGKPVQKAEPEQDEWAQFDVIQGGKA